MIEHTSLLLRAKFGFDERRGWFGKEMVIGTGAHHSNPMLPLQA